MDVAREPHGWFPASLATRHLPPLLDAAIAPTLSASTATRDRRAGQNRTVNPSNASVWNMVLPDETSRQVASPFTLLQK